MEFLKEKVYSIFLKEGRIDNAISYISEQLEEDTDVIKQAISELVKEGKVIPDPNTNTVMNYPRIYAGVIHRSKPMADESAVNRKKEEKCKDSNST